MDIEQFNLIEAYLDGKLSKTDHEEVESEIAQNSELSFEVKTLQEIRKGLNMIGLETKLNEALSRHKKEKRSGFLMQFGIFAQKTATKTWAIAASVILISSSVFLLMKLNKPNNLDAFNENYKPNFEDNFQTKNFDLKFDSNIKNGIAAYKSKNFDYAINLLKTVATQNSDEIVIKNYYLGVSFLAKNKVENAISSLLIAQKCTNTTIKDNADWYLALAYLKQNDKANMKAAFEKIATNKNSPYCKKAESLLKLLF
jgi:hypothetical protein